MYVLHNYWVQVICWLLTIDYSWCWFSRIAFSRNESKAKASSSLSYTKSFLLLWFNFVAPSLKAPSLEPLPCLFKSCMIVVSWPYQVRSTVYGVGPTTVYSLWSMVGQGRGQGLRSEDSGLRSYYQALFLRSTVYHGIRRVYGLRSMVYGPWSVWCYGLRSRS